MSKQNHAAADTDQLPFSATLHVRDHCMCLHLQRAARSAARLFDEALRPFGLTNGQFSLLMSLNRPEPPLMRDVASLLAMDRTTLTAMLKPLSRRGLLSIVADGRDRRGKRLVLSSDGKRLLTQALPVWTATEALLEKRLDADADRLRTDLRALG